MYDGHMGLIPLKVFLAPTVALQGDDDGVPPGDDPWSQRLLNQLHILDELRLDLLDLLVRVTVSRILTVLGDKIQHSEPPAEDAHEPHVVQEDGEPGDILGGPLVDLSLDNRVPLLDLHSLEEGPWEFKV